MHFQTHFSPLFTDNRPHVVWIPWYLHGCFMLLYTRLYCRLLYAGRYHQGVSFIYAAVPLPAYRRSMLYAEVCAVCLHVHAPCSMFHAPCCMLHAVMLYVRRRRTLHAPCPCPLCCLHVLCCMLYAPMLYAPCCMPMPCVALYVVLPALHAVRCMLYLYDVLLTKTIKDTD
jgi:hypothetical protein